MADLTRRDRTMMLAALECLRMAYTGEYEVAHFHRVEAVDNAVVVLRLANLHVLADALEGCGVSRHTMRATVARSVLYLRARLRADVGDFGAMYCTCFDEPRDVKTHRDARHCRTPHPRRITPLWEQAR